MAWQGLGVLGLLSGVGRVPKVLSMAQKRKSAGAGKSGGSKPDRKVVAVNRKARHLYEILEEFETGLVLRGTEVKSLRAGNISLDEAFGRIYEDVVFLVGAHIEAYPHASFNHDPIRKRQLLMRKVEARKLKAKVTQKGLTLVPLEVYFNERGIAKLSIGLGRGKKLQDKRQDLKKRDAERELRRQR
jgi:SsrA-binding protein